MLIAKSATRVPDHTAAAINEQIREQTELNIRHFASHTREIPRRLTELDGEWDVERMLETMSSTISLIGLTLGLTVNRRFLALPIIVQSFFLMHAIQGWCPPLPVLRRLGFRTRDEIDYERYALKALRGDFKKVPGWGNEVWGGEVLQAVQRH
jgi:hypothetical protein